MVDQKKVLKNLLDFYKKISPSKFEVKFINSVMDLVSEGDIEDNVFIQFCKDNKIGGELGYGSTTKKSNEVKPFRDYGNSGCDSGSSYSRSSC